MSDIIVPGQEIKDAILFNLNIEEKDVKEIRVFNGVEEILIENLVIVVVEKNNEK